MSRSPGKSGVFAWNRSSDGVDSIKGRGMKRSILVLATVAILSSCAAQQSRPPIHFSEQDDLNCKSYGITGGMLAQRRDSGLSEQAAMAEVQHEFTKLNNSDPRNRLALDFVDGQFNSIADTVYTSGAYKPKTILLFFPTLCLAKQAGIADQKGTAFIFSQALACQQEFPLSGLSQDFRVHDGPTMNLQACIAQATSPLFK
jgi:hypothetical protein